MLILLAAALAWAPLPTAESILDRYVAVTGGKAAYEKVRTEISHGKLEVAGQGVSGAITLYRAAPNKSYTLIEFEGVGKIEEGFDGATAWSINMQGARIKEGEERAVTARGAELGAAAHWRELFTKVELAGVEDVAGQPAYKVIATPKEGHPNTLYYDQKSNLLVKATTQLSTPMGDMPIETLMSDYQQSDGILSARRITQKIGPQEVVMHIERIERNVDIPPSRFQLPDAIKKLLKN